MPEPNQPSSTDTPLREDAAGPDPILIFRSWYEHAERARLHMPNAMVLATATRTGIPSARVVLLKEFDANGFVFFTNYLSRKGAELSDNPNGALLIFWTPLERQVRMEGTVEKISEEESDRYFHSRPRVSQISAAISEQSLEVESRQELERRARDLEAHLAGKAVPRPMHWGGYRLRARQIEFWQGRTGRLHDRLLYTLTHGGWIITRLQP
ncbi:MAG: pyridoxamine 5'-phosphate oxidase [Ignavibacteria bacterium]|nr:pyridoxamine 5'-phosphate oxidase [Ignavibacteria bacterium]